MRKRVGMINGRSSSERGEEGSDGPLIGAYNSLLALPRLPL